MGGERDVDNDTSGKITSLCGRTIVYQSVQLGQDIEEIESVGDPLTPTIIVEMVYD